MSVSLKGLRVAVAGAGVFGLSIAACAARRGAEVTVFDPAPVGDNASGVAAGMLSPAFETVLEGGDAARFDLFSRAYAAWPGFATAVGLPMADHGVGAIQVGDDSALSDLAGALGELGATAMPLAAAEIRARQPLYGGGQDGLWVAHDGRLDPTPTLAALAARLAEAGGRIVLRSLEPRVWPAGFDQLVIAAGHQAREWAEATPALSALVPIKGHILRFAVADHGGPSLRGAHGYLAPQADGVAFGASMEPGRADRRIDRAESERLHRRALALAPALAATTWTACAGVRAATPDGLPLVGATGDGVVVAAGARRNGWLIAPLAAQAAVEALEGADPWPAFDPARFDRK